MHRLCLFKAVWMLDVRMCFSSVYMRHISFWTALAPVKVCLSVIQVAKSHTCLHQVHYCYPQETHLYLTEVSMHTWAPTHAHTHTHSVVYSLLLPITVNENKGQIDGVVTIWITECTLDHHIPNRLVEGEREKRREDKWDEHSSLWTKAPLHTESQHRYCCEEAGEGGNLSREDRGV